MSAITRSGSAIVSVVTKWCPTRRTSSLPRKKRSTPTSRIVATAGEATIPPGLLQTRASVYQTSHTRYTPSARHELCTTGASARWLVSCDDPTFAVRARRGADPAEAVLRGPRGAGDRLACRRAGRARLPPGARPRCGRLVPGGTWKRRRLRPPARKGGTAPGPVRADPPGRERRRAARTGRRRDRPGPGRFARPTACRSRLTRAPG